MVIVDSVGIRIADSLTALETRSGDSLDGAWIADSLGARTVDAELYGYFEAMLQSFNLFQ